MNRVHTVKYMIYVGCQESIRDIILSLMFTHVGEQCDMGNYQTKLQNKEKGYVQEQHIRACNTSMVFVEVADDEDILSAMQKLRSRERESARVMNLNRVIDRKIIFICDKHPVFKDKNTIDMSQFTIKTFNVVCGFEEMIMQWEECSKYASM